MDEEQPLEPDWEELITALKAAEDWLMSEEGLDEADCIVRREAIALALGTISGREAGEDEDTLIREFFKQVNRAAFWLAGNCSDEALGDWVYRFCIEPDVERSDLMLRGVQGNA
jgi:hypothetical protein